MDLYEHDPAGRLRKVFRNGTLVEHYVYDANGNRTGASVAGLPQANPGDTTIDDQDRLLSYGPFTYTYTADGALASKAANGQSVQYAYDEFGNLRRVILDTGVTIDYLIDAQQRRVGKSIAGTVVKRWIYQDQLNPIAEVTPAGDILVEYIYGTKPHVPDYMVADGRTYRFVTDHLGSVRMVVRADTLQPGEQVIVQELDYDSFGRVINRTNVGFQPFGFAGGLYDSQTGLVRFGARDYDPRIGRWTAKDPILFAGEDTNLYAYVFGDPVNLVDPPGLWGIDIGNLDLSFGHPTLVFDDTSGTIFLDALAATADGVIPFADPFSDTYSVCRNSNLAISKRLGAASRDVALLAAGGAGYRSGREIVFGKNFRIAPFGNRTKHPLGRFPHYHRRGRKLPNGETTPGQGIGRHRPWESKSTDRNFWDRF